MENFPYHNISLAKVYLDIIYYFITTKILASGGYKKDLDTLPIKPRLSPYRMEQTKYLV